MTIAEYLEQQGLERGLLQGRQEGRQEGRKEEAQRIAAAMLRKRSRPRAGGAANRAGRAGAGAAFGLKLQDLFNEWDRQFSLGGNRCVIELIERHKQRAHFSIQPLEQESADVFRHLETA